MSALQPQPRPYSRIHWRTPITMVVLLMVLIGGAWWGWNSLTQSSAEANCVEQKLDNNRLVPKQVVVNVYNGGAKAGKAAEIAELLKKRGFNIGKIANEPKGDKYEGAALRGAAAGAPELTLVAGQIVQKPQTTIDNRPDHTVDLVVGHGFSALRLKGTTSVAVPPDSVHCLPIVRKTQPIPSGQNPN